MEEFNSDVSMEEFNSDESNEYFDEIPGMSFI